MASGLNWFKSYPRLTILAPSGNASRRSLASPHTLGQLLGSSCLRQAGLGPAIQRTPTSPRGAVLRDAGQSCRAVQTPSAGVRPPAPVLVASDG